jgi:hypothetical protein
MRKGIVMEIDDPYLTLLTPDGEFLRARKTDRLYSVGEEIDFFPVTSTIVSKKLKSIRTFFTLRSALMSAAVLMICLGSIIPVYQSNKAYAYMSIDASTSIEMGLNKKMEVVEIKGFDKEADAIISQLDGWKKKDVSELTAIIVAELKDEGQISQSEPVVISTVITKHLKDKAETKLQKNVIEIQQSVDQQLVEVKVYTTTEEEIEEARNSGVPVGIYQRSKNKSAKSKQTKEEKNHNIAPIESSAKSTLPPGQQKKQKNDSKSTDNKQSEILNEKSNNQNNNPIVNKQENGKQASPELNIDRNNKGNEKPNNGLVEQGENNKLNKQETQIENNKNNKQDKPKTNNYNKTKKQENNGKK